jgi:glucose-1-phosphate adenylyltransferase
MHKFITLILAGGQGNRLYPLTKMRSKPAVPIAGRFRLIDFPISNCIHSGLRKIYILTQFSSESLHRHIFLTYRFDNFTKDFIALLSAQQTLESRDWYQGTADAVRQNLHFLESKGDIVLILSGDHLYRMDYRKFIDFHLQHNADISISVYPVRSEEASEYGVMKVDENNRIVSFFEKPKTPAELDAMKVPESVFQQFGMEPKGRTHLASMGIYLFNLKTLTELLKTTSYEDFGREVIPFAIQNKKVFSFFFDGYWEDIGTIRKFYDAHIALTDRLPRFNLYDEQRQIFSHARFLPGSKILEADIRDSILCEGSIIDQARIENSIIGIRSRIGQNSHLERSVIMGADYFESQEEIDLNAEIGIPNTGIGKDCMIKNTIIDKNAKIGNGVRIENTQHKQKESTEIFTIQDGIVVIPKNTVIPDGTII